MPGLALMLRTVADTIIGLLVRLGVPADWFAGAPEPYSPPQAAPRARPQAAPPARAASPNSVTPNDVFTPTRPRAGRRRLVGRHAELARILQALNEEASHVVLYSERGRGKTSLSNLVVERLRRGGAVVGRHACGAESNFDQIIAGLLRDLPPSLLPLDQDSQAAATGAVDEQGCAAILPQRALTPADIAAIPGRLACRKLVFVVDEFDRVEDRATRTRLADTIKHLSDRGEKLLFMIVGVSSTLEHILGQHPSIERNIAAIHLPLLDDEEITEMLVRGGEATGIAFTPPACNAVAGIARGMPYMAQLMGLRITQFAALRGALETGTADIIAAMDRLIADASSDIAARYATLTAGPHGARMRQALDEIARAPQDKWGRITVPQASAETQGDFESLITQGVIQPAPGAPGMFQAADRRLIYHILLLAARNEAASVRSGSESLAEPLTATRTPPALRSVAAVGR
jgi:hypothetical protein